MEPLSPCVQHRGHLAVCIWSFQHDQLFSDHVENSNTARRPGKDERVVAKSKPMWNLVSQTVDRTRTALGSSASHSSRTLKAKSSNLDLTSAWKLVPRDSNKSTALRSQVWPSDVNPSSSTGKPVAETTDVNTIIWKKIFLFMTATMKQRYILHRTSRRSKNIWSIFHRN